MILTGGVDISEKEIAYVLDATINGWNEHHSDYVDKFTHSFSDYVTAKHAYATTGGTQALWLALATLGVGKGDEVILPDLTYFACSDVVVLLGAKPVFVDVDPLTWCISPEKIKKAITPRTKAIMPVWTYGNAPDMLEVMSIAEGIPIVEDSCPAVGSTVDGIHAGSFGTFGCFSFHGAKIMTTGFGGMVVTDDDDLMKRLVYLDDHGEDKSLDERFIQTDIGYSFYMHNINAALGLAQLERVDTFVHKKRQIFKWYENILGNIDGLSINYEQKGAFTNRWLTSIVLNKKFRVDRDMLMRLLRDEGIDTRPFFRAISSFKMYDEADTPVSHHLGLNGLNLPSGVQRTQPEIERIALQVKTYLCG